MAATVFRARAWVGFALVPVRNVFVQVPGLMAEQLVPHTVADGRERRLAAAPDLAPHRSVIMHLECCTLHDHDWGSVEGSAAQHRS